MPASQWNPYRFSAVFHSRRLHVANVRPVVHLTGALLANRSGRAFPVPTRLALVVAISNRWHRRGWSPQTCLGAGDAAASSGQFARTD